MPPRERCHINRRSAAFTFALFSPSFSPLFFGGVEGEDENHKILEQNTGKGGNDKHEL